MFLKVATTSVIALILLIGISQVVIPLWRGDRLFPFFGRRARLERELARWKADAAERALEQQISEHMSAALAPPPVRRDSDLPAPRIAEPAPSDPTRRKEPSHE